MNYIEEQHWNPAYCLGFILEMEDHSAIVYDAAIVGAGIMGLCTAFELARRGKSVILLEQFDFLHHRGSSHGESRTMRVTYPEDYYTLMATASLDLWRQAEREAGFKVYVRTGQLDFGHLDHPGLLQVIAGCVKHRIPHELLTREQVSEKFKMIELPKGYVAVYTQEAGVLRASKACAMFLSLALKHGAVLRDNAKVLKISTGWKASSGAKSVLVATSKGSVLAKKCIITSGAWTPKIVEEQFGLVLPVQPLHTNIAYWEVEEAAKQEFLAKNGFPAFAYYDRKYFYGTPSLEYPGLLKASIHGGSPCDADHRSYRPDIESVKKVLSPWISAAFKNKVKSDGPVMAEACMYAMTPDQDFILDFLPNTDRQILVATGFSGHGFKMGPLIGKVMAELALNGACNDVPLEYFSLDRFVDSPYGNKKNFDPVQELAALSLQK